MVKNPNGQVVDNACNGCHRMGVNNVGSGGTSLDFAIRAIGNATEASQNPHSVDSPLWMLPGQAAYDPSHETHAKAIRDCALRYKANPNGALPNGADCRISQYTGMPNSVDHYAAIRAKADGIPFIARHRLTAAQYKTEFDKNLAAGYTLNLFNGYTVQGQDFYAAIWEKRASVQWIARHGLTSAQYQAAFNQQSQNGSSLRWSAAMRWATMRVTRRSGASNRLRRGPHDTG